MSFCYNDDSIGDTSVIYKLEWNLETLRRISSIVNPLIVICGKNPLTTHRLNINTSYTYWYLNLYIISPTRKHQSNRPTSRKKNHIVMLLQRCWEREPSPFHAAITTLYIRDRFEALGTGMTRRLTSAPYTYTGYCLSDGSVFLQPQRHGASLAYDVSANSNVGSICCRLFPRLCIMFLVCIISYSLFITLVRF